MFVCREYHGTLTEDSHGLSSKAVISIAVESPVHFDQAELQDENATNTFSEGQCMLVQSSLACGLSARENRGILGTVSSIPLGVSLQMKGLVVDIFRG